MIESEKVQRNIGWRHPTARQLIDGVNKQTVGQEQQHSAGHINADFFRGPGFRHDFPGEVGAEEAERQVEVKNPAPADAVDQKAAEGRPGEKADVKRRRGETKGAAPLLVRQIHRDDGAAIGGDHRAAERLDGAEKDQLADRLR